MIRGFTLLFFSLVVIQLQVMTVDASMTLTSVNYTPPPPLVSGNQQHVIARYYLGPSGATTFIPSHQLQMQTELVNARWTIQVILNGLNAAHQSSSGSTAFVNGALLSYSLNNAVSLEVAIDGFVPLTQEGQIVILQVKEIDNSGSVVPGSETTVSQPVAGEAATTFQTTYPTPTLPPVQPSPTKSMGFPLTLGIGAIILVSIIMCIRRR
jgi:hypothetical protein